MTHGTAYAVLSLFAVGLKSSYNIREGASDMAKNKINNDVEYWQLREDLQKLESRIMEMAQQNVADKKVLKSLQKEAASLGKTMSSYEKKKTSDKKKQSRKEASVQKSQKKPAQKKKKEDTVLFSISAMEANYFDFTALADKQRSHLIFKKKQVLELACEGDYIQLYDDDTLYRIRKGTEEKQGQLYIVSVRYGDVLVQDIALIVHRTIKAAELDKIGQILN